MKPIIGTLISIFISLFLAGQNYIPIPSDSTSEWRIWTGYNDGMCIQNQDFKYFFDGDTVIGSFNYHRLYQSGLYYENPVGPPGTGCDNQYTFENIYIGGIRNDAGKVYLYKGSGEDLLYDFTLSPGDTLNTMISGSNVITSIDSVIIGNDYRRRFNLNSPDGYSNWIIEGLGHEKGLIEFMFVPLEGASDLYCYAENHFPVFPEGVYCDLNVTVLDYNSETMKMGINPNPSSGIFTITFTSIFVSNVWLKIISSSGNTVLDSQWDISPGVNEKTINLSSAQPGIYLAFIQFGTSYIQKKVILK